MSTVRCLTSAGRSVSQGYRILTKARKAVCRVTVTRHVSTSVVVWKDSSGVNDGGKKSAPPPPPVGSGGRSTKDGLCCPKCGDPFTHVETFVSKLISFLIVPVNSFGNLRCPICGGPLIVIQTFVCKLPPFDKIVALIKF